MNILNLLPAIPGEPVTDVLKLSSGGFPESFEQIALNKMSSITTLSRMIVRSFLRFFHHQNFKGTKHLNFWWDYRKTIKFSKKSQEKEASQQTLDTPPRLHFNNKKESQKAPDLRSSLVVLRLLNNIIDQDYM